MAKLWLFNPGHEEALSRARAKGGYTPTALVRQMMWDLAELMRFVSDEGDYILRPYAHLQDAQLLDHRGRVLQRADYPSEPLELRLWADEANAQRLALRLTQRMGLRLLPPSPISEGYLRLSHRSSARDFLEQYHQTLDFPSRLIPHWVYPQESEASTRRAICRALEELGEAVVIKRPYTSSGRGVEFYYRALDEERVEHLLQQCYRSGGISLEPRLERRQDWAAEYYVDSQRGEVRYVGLSHFLTAAEGSYLGNDLRAEQELHQQLAAEVGAAELERCLEAHRQYLAQQLLGAYQGWVGVDMMTYSDGGSGLRLHPCVEINVRTTMGLLAHRLAHQLADSPRVGCFRLSSYPSGGARAIYEEHLTEPERYLPLVHPDPVAQFYAWVAYPDSL